MKQKATLKNISKSLNLSISTVSRALKNHPDISESTKQKVTELATMLDYEPNTYAINLKTNRSKTIGLMVPVISPYFYHSFISAVEEESRKKDYSLFILQSGDDPAVELENLRLCRVNRVAGLFVAISSATKDIHPFLKLEEQGIPVIFFDKVPNYEACNKVCLADEDAGKLAAETLLKKDPQHILAIFGNPDLLITQKRQRSFLEAIAAAPKTIPVTVRYASSAEEAQHHCLESISFTSKPDLIFTMSDEILTGVIKALYRSEEHTSELQSH